MVSIEQVENKARELTEKVCAPVKCKFFAPVGDAFGYTIIFPTGCTIRAPQPIIDNLQQGSRGCEYYKDEHGNAGFLTPDGNVCFENK